LQVTRAAATPAGKGVNVSRFLHTAGFASTAWALVGRREVPWFREVLVAAGIGAGIFPVKGFTRQNVTIICGEDAETHLREPSPDVAPEEWLALAGAFASRVAAGDVVVAAGSIPKGVTAAMLAELVNPLALKTVVIADVNGPAAAGFFERARGVWFKGNRDEIAAITGGGFRTPDLAALLNERLHLPGLIATGGHEAVFAAVRSKKGKAVLFEEHPPKMPRVVSTVGAGDAFTAGIAAEASFSGLNETTFPAALKRALALASAALASFGDRYRSA